MSFDMSFGDGAGWGGDTSFATETAGKDSEAAKLGDRLPIPAQISLLASLSEEKIVFGDMVFSTACTIGDLKEINGVGQNKQFTLVDPQDENSTFIISAFEGVSEDSSSNEEHDHITLGTRLFIAGKLRCFGGVVSMFGYRIRVLDNELEYDCFVKESEIAKLYWQNNVPARLRNGETCLNGTAAGAPAPRGGAGGVAPSQSHATPSASRSNSSHQPATAAPVNKKFGDTRDKVLGVLQDQAKIAAETGSDRKDLHMNDIARQIGTDVKVVREALNFLSQEGTIYCTVDDEHYETV